MTEAQMKIMFHEMMLETIEALPKELISDEVRETLNKNLDKTYKAAVRSLIFQDD